MHSQLQLSTVSRDFPTWFKLKPRFTNCRQVNSTEPIITFVACATTMFVSSRKLFVAARTLAFLYAIQQIVTLLKRRPPLWLDCGSIVKLTSKKMVFVICSICAVLRLPDTKHCNGRRTSLVYLWLCVGVYPLSEFLNKRKPKILL